MEFVLKKEIKKWAVFLQKKYKKSFQIVGRNILQKKISSIYFFENYKKKQDRRIFIGALKYIPIIISYLFKSCPMPWHSCFFLNALVHKTGVLFILKQNVFSIEPILSSQWSIWWLFSQKKKINQTNLKRITFPQFDDEESLLKYVQNENFLGNPTLKKTHKLSRNQYLKEWFYKNYILFSSFLKKINRKKFFLDFILISSFIEIQILSDFRFFWTKSNNFFRGIQQIKDSILETGARKTFRKYVVFKNLNIKRKPKFFKKDRRFEFLYFSNYKFQKLTKHFVLKKFSTEFLKWKNNPILSEKKNFIKENFRKKNIGWIFGNFFPFFYDFFFSEKQSIFLMEIHEIDEEKKSGIFFAISPHKIPLIRKIIFGLRLSENVEIFCTYFNLLKNYFFNFKNSNNYLKKKKTSFSHVLKKNYHFSFYETNWIDGGICVCFQGFNMLSYLMGRKNLFFLNLDFNFNLKPNKTLTTKERKKSRFSNSFHITREILRFKKILIDCHLQFRIGNIDSFQLSDSIHYVFTHVGILTGIYRYKYKILRQIYVCNLIKRVLLKKFNKKGGKKTPGFGIWAPVWRIWIFFLRGLVPLIERWMTNLLSRHFGGRKIGKKFLEFTRQRKETYFDIGLKKSFIVEIKNQIRVEKNSLQLNNCFKHLNDAWKCWKSNILWKIPVIPKNFEIIILKYVKLKADWWIKTAYQTREKIKKGNLTEKKTLKKNLGQMTRLWFKAEQKRQFDFLKTESYVCEYVRSIAYETFFCWADVSGRVRIEFPSFSRKTDTRLLILAIESLNEQENLDRNKSNPAKSNGKFLEDTFENPSKALSKLKEKLTSQKIFCDIGIDFADNLVDLLPIFRIEIQDNITDTYLDQYIWFNSAKLFFFPDWVKPSDLEIAPLVVYKTCLSIHDFLDYHKFSSSENFFFFQGHIVETYENIDLSFLCQFLKLGLDSNLAKYIDSRFNSKIFYKDMAILNSFGLFQGLTFYSFILQYYSLLIDLSILGIKNALFLNFKDCLSHFFHKEEKNPIQVLFYTRYISEFIIVSKKKSLKLKFALNENRCLEIKLDENSYISNAYFLSKFKESLPFSLGKIFFNRNYKKYNPINLDFSKFKFIFCGFEVFTISFFYKKYKNFWLFGKKKGKISSCAFFPIIGRAALKKFENRIRQILLTTNSTTFTKIANKWNSNILGIILYFREGCLKNINFLKLSSEAEKKIHARIKLGFNSKMPSRFPPVLFYSPKELGGLGLISMANSVVSEEDLKYSKRKNSNIKSFLFGKTKKNNIVPSLISYILMWKNEFIDSQLIWKTYLKRRSKNISKKIHISMEDVEDLWNRGIPRINTLFQKERHALAYDHGWRVRGEFKKYRQSKIDPFWWTNQKHDGKLYDLNNYRIGVMFALGGVENIIEHTLFKGTYFSSWEGLFWEKTSGFENSFCYRKTTKAQRSGLNQIPNRRFTLWWSPTINRGNVFIGFQVQLDLTGIFMHGKIPNLKISLIQIFRAHLWQKIHESLTINICQRFDEKMEILGIQTVQKEQIHPRKSYKMNSSSADIILFGLENWKIGCPSLLYSSKHIENANFSKTNKIWIDIQLRWGDFDSHDVERYSREKFLSYSTDKKTFYPSKSGILVAVDLSYNIFSAFGFWFNGLKLFMNHTLACTIKTNPALFILRERVRKGLQLFIAEQQDVFLTPENFSDIFRYRNTWIIDDSCFYRVSIHKKKSGDLVAKPMNGALFVFIPNSGILYLKISHVGFWKKHKRLFELSKWKAAEEISSFIDSFPVLDRPQLLITSRKAILDPLGLHLIHNPNILMRGTEIYFPLPSLLRIDAIGVAVLGSPHSRLLIYKLYENWLESITSFTAFSRIILILRSMEIDFEQLMIIFGSSRLTFSDQKLWPNFSNQKWIKIENLLRDLILENYMKKTKTVPKFFSQNDIRSIVLGIDLHQLVENHKEEIDETKNFEKVKTHNNFQKNLQVSIFTEKERCDFISWTDWKFRSSMLSDFYSFKINLDSVIFKKKKPNFILPKNLVKHFATLGNRHFQTGAFLFGNIINKNEKFSEIRIFCLPPQIFKGTKLDLSCFLPRDKNLNKFDFLGVIRSTNENEKFPNKNDEIIINSIIKKNFRTFETSIAFLLMGISSKFCEIVGFLFDIKNGMYILRKTNCEISILLTDKFFGFFLIPKNKKWNFFFQPMSFLPLMRYAVFMGIPTPFFHFIESF